MKAQQIDPALQERVFTQGERLVFWHDPDYEFYAYIEALLLELRQRLEAAIKADERIQLK